MDAIVALHATLAPAGASGWLLDGDISGFVEAYLAQRARTSAE